ncbi:MAG: SLC13 family permease, partial [Planctomycetales bacterium]|nr:SLC13 family permease [Planctomycetales bacterium]
PNAGGLQGKTLRQIQFGRRHGVRVLAIHRQGMNISDRIGDLRLRFGDTLLMQGTRDAVEELQDDPSLLLLSRVREPVPRRHKRWLAILIIVGVMLGASLGHLPIANVALIGAL